MELHFKLLGEVPSKKNRWRRGASGQVYIPEDVKGNIDGLIRQCQSWRNKNRISEPMTGPIKLTANFLTSKSLDLDNMVTTLCDVLQSAGIIKNDKLICSLTASKIEVEKEKEAMTLVSLYQEHHPDII